MERAMMAYFLRMPTKVRSLDESSGCFSTAAVGVAIIGVSIECVESVEGTGEGFLTEDPEDEEAMRYLWKDTPKILQRKASTDCGGDKVLLPLQTYEAPCLRPNHDDCA